MSSEFGAKLGSRELGVVLQIFTPNSLLRTKLLS